MTRIDDRLVALAFRRQVRGAGRLTRTLYGASPLRTVRTTLGGLPWEVDPLDWMDAEILRTGSYEPEITTALLDALEPGDTLWDVGANGGVHAVQVAARRPDVRVVAVEPSPLRYTRLVGNATLNQVQVESYCIALADEPGYRPLSVVNTGNSGHTSLRPWEDATYEAVMPCWCDTGDALIQRGTPHPNVLKIDVEGAEELVLSGMPKALCNVRTIIFEAPADGGPAVEMVRGLGFAVDRLPATGGGVNYLAVRFRSGRQPG